MVKLVARSPFAATLPRSIGTVLGTVTLAEIDSGPVTSVAPFKGQTAAVSAALRETTGVVLPDTGRCIQTGGVTAVWAGQGITFVLGAGCAGIKGAAITDQSDAWVHVSLTGAGAVDVLARLVPIDLRASVFPAGHAARTLVGHMSALIWRDVAVFHILVFRSMAGTLLHELETAMIGLAARPEDFSDEKSST